MTPGQAENTPFLETERLVLRRFEEGDINALYSIFGDERVNKFLPWFPLKSVGEAEAFFEERYRAKYERPAGYNYAVCLKSDNVPVGYVNLDMGEGHDLGYGLKSEFWHRGMITEACLAVLKRAEEDKIPYVTATHDVQNPASGNVMRRLGMRYVYTYEEQWQPKDFPVAFRMYQKKLFFGEDWLFRKYWDGAKVRYVEPGL